MKETTAESISEAFARLIERAQNEDGISPEDIMRLKSVASLKSSKVSINRVLPILMLVVLLMGAIPPILITICVRMDLALGYNLVDGFLYVNDAGSAIDEPCIVQMHPGIAEPFRQPIACNECANVTEVHRVDNLSHEKFLERYAYSMQPVIVTDSQSGWTATNTFSFDFFREVYSNGSKALERVDSECQFFPYQTELNTLSEALSMNKDRVEGRGEPWYVGWSNCDGKTANILRKHYKFPYFLPSKLDHSKTDWIFMGLPGYGAPMHIDRVGAASWQAQIQGTKKWVLEAPPECAGICTNRIEIVVEPGETIVIDGNKWYHSTLIIGNDTSIVIGSEYY